MDKDPSLLTTHYVGSPWDAFYSPELLDNHGWLNISLLVIFSHSSSLTYEDAQVLRQTNQDLCPTAESEFRYGHVNPSARNIQDQTALGINTRFAYRASNTPSDV